MKVLALIILAVSLVVGIIGAVTAYSPRIDDAGLSAVLHLNAPAGVRTDLYDPDTRRPSPAAEQGTQLSPELIAELKESGEHRLRLREFSFGRWTGWWMFAIGCAGLLASGLFLRQQAKRELALEAPGGPGAQRQDPAVILESMRREVAEVLAAVGAMPSQDSTSGAFAALPIEGDVNQMIIQRMGMVQATLMPAFIEARPRLVAAFGMAGYARLMDPYAAAERQINRSWSAAADNDEEEAITSLRRGLALLEEASRRLPG